MKKYIFLVAAFATVICAGCSDPAIGDVYGDVFIYMPQATHNLGTDNNLNLTLSAAAVAKNPSLCTQTTLGIYRSSTQKKERVTVELVINTDTLTKAKAIALATDAPEVFSIYKTGVLLEPQYYDPLPDKLTIEDGSREATTQLVLHNKAIFDKYSPGQLLLLPVQIKNPTKYALKESLSLSMVVISIEN